MTTALITEEVIKSSPFAYLYKNVSRSFDSQEERRNAMLQRCKELRHNLVDNLRELANKLFECNECSDLELLENDETNQMDFEETEHDSKKYQKFHLMQSEWFCNVPDDLEDNWFVKFVPEGCRVLLIAKKSRTCIFKCDRKIFTMKTKFPGGGLNKLRGMTILDCIFSIKCKKIFVLDCLCWNNLLMNNCDSMFRFSWLTNMFNENTDLFRTSTKYSFHLLNPFPAEKSLIQHVMLEPFLVNDKQILYDGVVFYHKESTYIIGISPLVGWLFSYMLPEKLGIDILNENRAKMPKNYECLEVYLANLEAKRQKKYQKV